MKPLLYKFLLSLSCLAFSLSAHARVNISHTLLEPYTHDPHFEWIVGQLKFLGVEGPTWHILYDEKNNKKFLLLHDQYIYEPPANFKDGDMVVLVGRVKHMEMSSFMSGDYYNVSRIELLETHNAAVKLEQQQEEEKNKGKH